MKIVSRYIIYITFVAGAISCKKDNYRAPSSLLTGHIVYQGASLEVENGKVPFEVYQYGFGKISTIAGTFTQDGRYSLVLFDGNYLLTVPNIQAPFLWPRTNGSPDSIAITLKGNKTFDLNVMPYYMIRNPQITGAGGNVSGTFKAEKIITDPATGKDIERVSLYINKTELVSSNNDYHIAAVDLPGASITDPNNISLSVGVPASVSAVQNYVFARIGLKIAGVENMIFSPVTKVQF